MSKKKYLKGKDGKFAGSLPEKPKTPKLTTDTKPIPLEKIYEKENGQIGVAGKKFRDGRESGIAYERNKVLSAILSGIETISMKLVREDKKLSEYDKAYLKGELDALKAVAKSLTKKID